MANIKEIWNHIFYEWMRSQGLSIPIFWKTEAARDPNDVHAQV